MTHTETLHPWQVEVEALQEIARLNNKRSWRAGRHYKPEEWTIKLSSEGESCRAVFTDSVGDRRFLFFSKADLEPFGKRQGDDFTRRCIFDGSRIIVLGFDGLTVISEAISQSHTRKYEAPVQHFCLDREKFRLLCLMAISKGTGLKEFSLVVKLSSLNGREKTAYQVLSWEQIMAHPSCGTSNEDYTLIEYKKYAISDKQKFCKTLLNFVRNLAPDKAQDLKDRISQLLANGASIRGCYDHCEFSISCGYNAGIILRGNDWSMHS